MCIRKFENMVDIFIIANAVWVRTLDDIYKLFRRCERLFLNANAVPDNVNGGIGSDI